MQKLIRLGGYSAIAMGLLFVNFEAQSAGGDPCASFYNPDTGSGGENPAASSGQDLINTCNSSSEAGEQLTPYQALAQSQMAFAVANQQFRNVKNRMMLLHRGLAKGLEINGLSSSPSGQLIPPSMSQLSKQMIGAASGDEQSPFDKFGIFVNGNFGVGDKDATSRELGFGYDSQGVTAGIDYRFSEHLVVGGTFGYNAIKSDFSSSRGNLNLDGYSFSLYSTYYTDNFYLDGIFSGGWNDYDTRRNIQLPGVNQTLKGLTQGNDYAFNLSGGYDFHHQGLNYGPYGRISYQNIQIGGYQENPSNPGGPGFGTVTTIGKQNAESMQTALGGQLSYAISTSFGVLMPTAKAEWVHEFKNGSTPLNWRFSNAPNQSFVNLSDNPSRNFANLGTGLSATFAHGASAFLYYEAMVGRATISEHIINAGLRAEF